MAPYCIHFSNLKNLQNPPSPSAMNLNLKEKLRTTTYSSSLTFVKSNFTGVGVSFFSF
jgi:hypothetical protein